MGDFLYSIGKSLLSISIKQALMGAGLGLASYAGISTMLDSVIDKSIAQMQAGDGVALAMLGLSGMDTALSMVLSAALVRAAIFSTTISLTKAQ